MIEDGSDPITFYVSKIKIHEEFYSDKCVELLESIISNKQDKNLYRSLFINKIIEWGWRNAAIYLYGLFLFNGGFFTILIIFSSMKMPPLEWKVLIVIYNSFLAGYEII